MSINKTNIQWTHLPCRECHGLGHNRPDIYAECPWCDGTGSRQGYTANPIRFRNRETGEPVTWACVKVSDGCKNCYAESLALRYGKGSAYTVPNMAKLEPVLDEKVIHEMLTSRNLSGAAVFLGDMTDLFGEWVADAMLDRIFATMALRPDVTWQLLTKRPERMRAYVERVNWYECTREGLSKANPVFEMIGKSVERGPHLARYYQGFGWPLPNVWLGTSVEDQAAADERIPDLLATPAAVRFLSCEPLLGPINITGDPDGLVWPWAEARAEGHGIDWVIVGGESGPHARPCNVEWIRDIVGQCQAAGVPVFVKQLGSRPYQGLDNGGFEIKLRSRHGSDPDEWPEDLRVREFPEVVI